MKSNLKKFLIFGLISVILLVLLFSRIDYKDTWEAIKSADINYLIAAFFIFILSTIMILWRWMILMKALNLKFKRFSSVRWFFMGLFLNLLLPSAGDAFRGLGLSKETGDKTKVFASIVLDRLIGFVSIVIVAVVAFLFNYKTIQNMVVVISIISMVIILTMVVFVLFNHRIYSLVCRVFSSWPKFKNSLMKLHYDIVLMKGKVWEGIGTIILSIGSQIVYASEFYLIAKAMHLKVSFGYFVIFSPLVCVVSFLPSIGGLGVREFGWVSLLKILGVPEAVASGLSLISFSLMVIVCLLGGIFYVSTLSTRRVQHHQADGSLQPGNA